MNRGILGLAIAVPTVLFMTLPSLADSANTQVTAPRILVKPGIKTGLPALEVGKIQTIGGGGINEAPGVASTPKGPKGPPPPKRDVDGILHQVGNIGIPAVNTNIPNENIKTAPVVR